MGKWWSVSGYTLCLLDPHGFPLAWWLILKGSPSLLEQNRAPSAVSNLGTMRFSLPEWMAQKEPMFFLACH